jgi:uncharacterized protein (TIGR03643 family)
LRPAKKSPFFGDPAAMYKPEDEKSGHAMQKPDLDPAKVGEIIEMALSDAVSFQTIHAVHGLAPDAVKALMRRELKPGSYRAWRKRVRQFSDRREIYK